MCREVLKAPNRCHKQSSSCISPVCDAETQSFVFHFTDHGSWSSVFYLLPGNQTLQCNQQDVRSFAGGTIQFLLNLISILFFQPTSLLVGRPGKFEVGLYSHHFQVKKRKLEYLNFLFSLWLLKWKSTSLQQQGWAFGCIDGLLTQ